MLLVNLRPNFRSLRKRDTRKFALSTQKFRRPRGWSGYRNPISIGYNVQIMISPLPSYDELLNSAYANVSLTADKTWTFDPEDPFRKLNRSLWLQVRRVTNTYPVDTVDSIKAPFYICIFKLSFSLISPSLIVV